MRRLIFTLLYDQGNFMLSRNFRLQKVGAIDWLFKNYDLASVSHGLDELMVLDVSRGARDAHIFAEQVAQIAERCFIPMTVGGGIRSLDIAHKYLHSGADKLLVNSAFATDPIFCQRLTERYGSQCIIAGIDYRGGVLGDRSVTVQNGTQDIPCSLSEWVKFVQECGAGEILLQSIERDGTGTGLDLSVISELDPLPEAPCILMGGVGKAENIIAGLSYPGVDAVATANLFNFIGSAFLETRRAIRMSGLKMAYWTAPAYDSLKGRFASQSSASH